VCKSLNHLLQALDLLRKLDFQQRLLAFLRNNRPALKFLRFCKLPDAPLLRLEEAAIFHLSFQVLLLGWELMLLAYPELL